MAELKQRVFMIFIRPCFVKSASTPGYPNTVTKYIGKMYRAPMGSEKDNAPTVSKTGYSVAIELPALNSSVGDSGAKLITGGGIERYYGTSVNKMPENKPDQATYNQKDLEVQQKEIVLRQAEENLDANPTDPELIKAVHDARVALDRAKAELASMKKGASVFSAPPFNESNWFSNDYWALHSTWTSFEACKNYAKQLIDLLGIDGVMISNYVELDIQILPNK